MCLNSCTLGVRGSYFFMVFNNSMSDTITRSSIIISIMSIISPPYVGVTNRTPRSILDI